MKSHESFNILDVIDQKEIRYYSLKKEKKNLINDIIDHDMIILDKQAGKGEEWICMFQAIFLKLYGSHEGEKRNFTPHMKEKYRFIT